MSEREWKPIESAPKDGTWVILNIEVGGDVFGARVGRWNPRYFEGLGTYEWQAIDGGDRFDRPPDPDSVDNHWSDGRVYGWIPMLDDLPSPPEGD